jgi:hypothetical protein
MHLAQSLSWASLYTELLSQQLTSLTNLMPLQDQTKLLFTFFFSNFPTSSLLLLTHNGHGDTPSLTVHCLVYIKLNFLCNICSDCLLFIAGLLLGLVIQSKDKCDMKNGIFWDVTPCGSCKN